MQRTGLLELFYSGFRLLGYKGLCRQHPAVRRELYYPVRLKSYGKNNLDRLAAEGVSHIELRTVDLNPYELSGINLKDLKFIQLLFAWIASNPRKELTLRDQVQAAQNFKKAAHYDLKTVKIVIPKGKSLSVVKTGFEVLEQMKKFYRDFPDDVMEILGKYWNSRKKS